MTENSSHLTSMSNLQQHTHRRHPADNPSILMLTLGLRWEEEVWEFLLNVQICRLCHPPNLFEDVFHNPQQAVTLSSKYIIIILQSRHVYIYHICIFRSFRSLTVQTVKKKKKTPKFQRSQC